MSAPSREPVAEPAAWPRVSWIAALLILAIGYRIGIASSQGLWNTAPLMAMCLGGGLLLGWRFFWVPAVLVLVSDLFLGLSHGTGPGGYTLVSAAIYTLAALGGAAIGSRFRDGGGGRRWWLMLAGTWGASLAFYLLSNTYVWMMSPEYAKSLAGWWQSQTIGIPGPFPPSIYFLRNALIGDTIWCLMAAPLFLWRPVCEADPALA